MTAQLFELLPWKAGNLTSVDTQEGEVVGERMKAICVICTDQIEENFSAAPCGHTFHFECLSEWLLNRESCPQCRMTCKPKNVIKLFVTSNELTINDLQSMEPKDMRQKISIQEKMMTQKDNALEEARSLLGGIQNEMIAWQLQHKETYKKLKAEQSFTGTLKKQLVCLQHEFDEVKELKIETEKLRTRLSTFEVVEKMLKGSKEEIDMIVLSHSSPAKLATVIVALKKDYDVLRGKRVSLVKEKDKLVQQIKHTKKQLENKEIELQISQDQILTLESDLHAAEEEKRNSRKKVEMLLQRAIDSPGSYHTLKRILESPMPDLSTRKLLNEGASPLLISEHSRHHLGFEDTDSAEEPKMGVKRLCDNKENNIVMPIPKKCKKLLLKPKAFSSQVLKNDLKFAPRKKFLFSKK